MKKKTKKQTRKIIEKKQVKELCVKGLNPVNPKCRECVNFLGNVCFSVCSNCTSGMYIMYKHETRCNKCKNVYETPPPVGAGR